MKEGEPECMDLIIERQTMQERNALIATRLSNLEASACNAIGRATNEKVGAAIIWPG